MKKRVVSWLLVVLMLTSMLPTGVWAEDVYRSSEDTGRYGVSTLASAADAELEGFFNEWEGIATVANAATRGFVRDGEELKSGNSTASYTRSTLTVTMLKAAELSFDYRLSGPSQSGMEVKNGSKTLYTYSSYGSSGAEIVKGTDSGTATVQANAGDVITISYYRGWASSGSNCMWLSNFKASLPAQVIFHANDGTETTVQQGVFGSGTLQANTFQRDGYRFEGWATTPDGAVAYADKDSITITENTDLYAVWTRVYRVAFQLTPADAQFSLYGDEARTALIAADSGTAYTLAAGTYYYSVSAFGYAAVQGSVTVSGDAQEPVVLAEKPVVTVTFAYADGKTDVDGGKLTVRTGERDMAAEEGSDGMAFRLPAGYAYDWSFRSANYGKQSGTVDLTGVSESGTRSVTIPMTAKSAWEGAGDISEPAAVDGVYQITSGSELAWLAQQVNAGVSDGTSFSAVLCNDIDLGDEAWTPIGNGTGKAYKGTFDGQGYTIRNLYVTGSTPMDYGLFGTVNGGTVRNVTVEGRVEVTSNSSRYGIAAIVGQLYGTTGGVENCLNRASVKGGQYVGGIVGYVAGGYSSDEKFIKNCGNMGDVTSEGHRAAGIAANISGQVAVENCYSTGTITGGGWYSGGISAYVDSSYASVKNCYAAGSVTGSGAGAVFGKVSYSSTVVANCYYPDTLSVSDSKAVKVTEQQLKTLDSAAALGEAFMQDAKSVNGGYPILTWQITTYEVTFTVMPEDAEVRIDGAKGKQNGNVWTFRLPEGTYSYTAFAFGYADESGNIEVSGAARKDITLTPVEKRTVRFSVTPKDAGAAVTVQWNGKTVAAEQDGSYRLPDGTYTYTVRAKGYAKVSQTLEVSGDVTVPVTLEPSAAWDGQTVTAPEVGDGTEASPYEIENGEQLAWLAQTVNAGNGSTRLYAVLTEDIDLGDGVWTPIGADSHEFTGRFDGQGHTVSRMKAETRYAGLFGVVKDAEIRGVVVQGIAASTDSSSGDAAGLVARTKGSTVTITECGSEVAVSGGNNGGNKPDSGFQYDQSEGVWNCYYNSENTGAHGYGAEPRTGMQMRLADFVRELGSGIWTRDDAVNGGLPYLTTVKAPETAKTADITVHVAVVTYDKETYTFDFDHKSVVDVTVESTGNTRVVDVMDAAQAQGKLTYSYSTTATFGRFIHTINGHAVNAPDGWMFTINDALSNVSASTASVKDGDRVLWFEGTTENQFQGPLWAELDGSTIQWETISTVAELQALAASKDPAVLAKNYKLARDLDLSGVTFSGIGSASAPFTGMFDGQGHTVSHVTVKGGDNAGFFNVTLGAVIKNLHLSDVNVTGGSRVGGLVGWARAELDRQDMAGSKAGLVGSCTVSGTVSGSRAVGGLVGLNEGLSDQETMFSVASAVDKCTAAVSVSGKEKVGGLAGENSGSITKSAAQGSATAPDGVMVGGFAGDNSGGIYDSHAEGEVRGKSYAGGFVGISDGTVKNCYSLGSVAGTDYTGGFAGGISAAENAVGAGLVSVTGTPTYGYTGGFAGRLGGTLAGLDNQITVKNVYGNCMKPDGQWKAAGNSFTGSSEQAAVEGMKLTTWQQVNDKLMELFGVSLPWIVDDTALMDSIAATLTETKDGWSAMDMAAYGQLAGKTARLTDAARQNIMDLLIAEASGTTDAGARSRIELVLRALGVDSTELYPQGSGKAVNNGALLKAMDMSSVTVWAAPYVLLANMQGGVKLTDQQIETLIATIAAAESNGILGSSYGGAYYADPDTTGAAMAALSAYTDRSSAKTLLDKLVRGAANHVAGAGYYSNANSDAMLIIGFIAAGVDPETVLCASGITLVEDMLRYANDANNGFLYAGEDNALATEQGFRALVALAQFRANGGKAYNIYNFSKTAVKPGHATGSGEPDVPVNPPEENEDITVTVSIRTPAGMWMDGKSVTVKKGSTVYHAFIEALRDSGITQSGAASGYVRSMTKGGVTYGEFTHGDNSGWLYKVNGVLPNVALTQKKLADGDDILWYYTTDWKQDPDAGAMAGQSLTAADVIKLIDAIGNVTLDSGSAIAAARTAYNRLPAEEKALVTNYAVLVAAEETYAALVKAQQATSGVKENTAWRTQYETALDKAGENDLTFGSEWLVIALARSGRTVPDSYYDSVVKAVQDAGGELSDKKFSEYSRVILALTAIGKDPADVGGYDLLAKLADMDKVTYQGLNGAIFALIALDSAGYEVPAAAEDANQTSREALVAYILDKQLSDGGWALSGDSADPDMTAMAVQALAAYRDDAAVQAAVDKAVQTLSDMQLSDGGYSSWGTVNSESCAQVIIALTTLGIDPAKDSRFIKYGLSLLDALCAYYKDGGFCHTRDGAADDIATEQALCALTAYARLLNGQTALYDMTDLAAGITPAEPDAQEPAEEQEPAAQNGAVVWIVVAAAAAAAGAAVIAASKRRKKE